MAQLRYSILGSMLGDIRVAIYPKALSEFCEACCAKGWNILLGSDHPEAPNLEMRNGDFR